MAIISMFYGIIISLYFFDNRRHKKPHIHVQYQDEQAVVSIPDGEILEGTIKSNKLKLIQAWLIIHKDEIMADWKLASEGNEIFKIDPLK
ncbi:MAG: DUF4160 domain-containing protein [Spirochaetia bacterium]